MRCNYKKWKEEKLITDLRGGHNKLFTEKEERDLYEYIRKVFIDCNLSFNNVHLKFLAIQQYHMLQKEKNIDYVENVEFTISCVLDGFVTIKIDGIYHH